MTKPLCYCASLCLRDYVFLNVLQLLELIYDLRLGFTLSDRLFFFFFPRKMEVKMNRGGDQETKSHDKRTEETKSLRTRNQLSLRKKSDRFQQGRGGGKKKTNKTNHLAITNYEKRLLIKKRFIVAVNEKKKQTNM